MPRVIVPINDNPTYFESRQAFRAWLEANHDKVDVLEIGFYKKGSGRPSVAYEEAVEEALCFGWIDGVRHAVDELSYRGRFTPRRAGSRWSDVNVRRVQALQQQGLMTEAGLRAFEGHDAPSAQYSAEGRDGLPEPYLSRLRANDAAWQFFSEQAPWYQRTAGYWVMDAKREETRQRRLATLIADCEAGRRIAPLARAGGR